MTHTEPGRNLGIGTANAPVQGGKDPRPDQVNGFLAAFKVKPLPTPPKDNPKVSMEAARAAYWSGAWDELEATYRDAKTTRAAKEQIRQMMLGEDGGLQALSNDPGLARTYLGAADPEFLRESDLFTSLGRKKDDVLASTLMALTAKRPAAKGDPSLDRDSQRDPELFHLLAEEINIDVWNDTSKAIGAPKRGLGTRVCASLWNKGGYDDICALIEMGVDTTLGARSVSDDNVFLAGSGMLYSGFVMPLQHKLQEYLPDIDKLGTSEEPNWDDAHKVKVNGAKKIFDKLNETRTAATLTNWKDIKNSEMIAEFQKMPGTIWGFERVRGPYVRAAHETKQGVQPLRMMELWDAVTPVLSTGGYEELLQDPKAQIKKVVDQASKVVGDSIDEANQNPTPGGKYDEVRRDKNEYLKRFREDATAFLTEFVAQVPKGTFARDSQDPGEFVSNIAGTDWNKFMNSFACKAGLWLAKSEGKPVYYCLDGINMDDVADYKKVKNKAIEEYLAEGGATVSRNPHKEVVTMKEVREILRNWDDLQHTVRFVDKGKILKGQELQDAVDKWQKKMAAANAEAKRTPAPPKASFAKELAAIDPNLSAKLDDVARRQGDPTETDQDARDIVRKAGYLLKIANTRPDYALKYLMSKCGVLAEYGLIPAGLADAAASLAKLASLDPPAPKSATDQAAADLVAQLKLCPVQFRQPLAEALVRYPLLQRAKKAKAKLKKM